MRVFFSVWGFGGGGGRGFELSFPCLQSSNGPPPFPHVICDMILITAYVRRIKKVLTCGSDVLEVEGFQLKQRTYDIPRRKFKAFAAAHVC